MAVTIVYEEVYNTNACLLSPSFFLLQLQHLYAVYREDGPSLPMGQQLCRHRKPQVLPPLLLLRVFRVHLRRRPRRRTILIVRYIIK